MAKSRVVAKRVLANARAKANAQAKGGAQAKGDAPTPGMSVPIEAIPHMFNQKVLEWEKAHFQALSEIHKVLVEIRDLLKE